MRARDIDHRARVCVCMRVQEARAGARAPWRMTDMYVRYEITCHGCLLVYAQIYFDRKNLPTFFVPP